MIVYNQKSLDACAVYSVAASIGNALNIWPTDKEIRAFYEKHKGVKGGMRIHEVLEKLKTEPLAGVKVKTYDHVYDRDIGTPKGKLRNKTAIHNIKKALKEGKGVIMGMILNKEKPKIDVSGWGHYVKQGKEDGVFHALSIVNIALAANRTDTIIIQNSWGEDFGYGGYCNLRAKYLPKIATDVYTVEFTQ